MMLAAQRVLSLVALLLLASCDGGVSAPKLSPLVQGTLDVDLGSLLDYQSEAPASDRTGTAEYSVTELALRRSLGVSLKSHTSGLVRINGQFARTNETVAVTIQSIDVDQTITVEHLDATGAPVTQIIHTRPQSLPQFQVVGQTSSPGEITLTPNGQNIKNYLLSLDGTGKVLFYKRSLDKQLSDFKRHKFAGATRYSYMEGIRILPIGYLEGKTTVLDENYVTKAVIDGALPNPARGRGPVQTENHDFLLLADNHYIVSAYYGRVVNNIPGVAGDVRLVSSLLQEVRDGNVIWEWDSADHPELFAQAEEGNVFNATTWSDYAHFNAMVIDPYDGTLLASFRGLNAIFKIDRRDGAILWRFGGVADEFGLTTTQTPQGQHSVRVFADGSMAYFDNNTTCLGVLPLLRRFHTPDPQNAGRTACDIRGVSSRVTTVRLDEGSRRVLSFREVRFPNPAEDAAVSGRATQVTSFRGSVVEMPNGNLFVGFGSNSSGERDAVEWNVQTGQPVFALYFDKLGQPSTQIDGGSYRALFSAY
jgi:hypothetical protein